MDPPWVLLIEEVQCKELKCGGGFRSGRLERFAREKRDQCFPCRTLEKRWLNLANIKPRFKEDPAS
jgi:hypothetical protein